MDDAPLALALQTATSTHDRGDADLARLSEVLKVAARRRGLTASEIREDLDEQLDALARTELALAGATDGRTLAARPLLDGLAAAFHPAPHRIAMECDPKLRLSAPELTAVGVVVCEAIANALRYAFPEGRQGAVWVKLVDDGGRRRLTIRDNGIGISDIDGSAEGGARMIHALAESFGGYARLGSAPFGGGLVTMIYPRPA